MSVWCTWVLWCVVLGACGSGGVGVYPSVSAVLHVRHKKSLYQARPAVGLWVWVCGCNIRPGISARRLPTVSSRHFTSRACYLYILPGVSAVAIGLGRSHTCVISSGGGVKCWGYNGFGQLGSGSFSSVTRPTDVAGA